MKSTDISFDNHRLQINEKSVRLANDTIELSYQGGTLKSSEAFQGQPLDEHFFGIGRESIAVVCAPPTVSLDLGRLDKSDFRNSQHVQAKRLGHVRPPPSSVRFTFSSP